VLLGKVKGAILKAFPPVGRCRWHLVEPTWGYLATPQIWYQHSLSIFNPSYLVWLLGREGFAQGLADSPILVRTTKIYWSYLVSSSGGVNDSTILYLYSSLSQLRCLLAPAGLNLHCTKDVYFFDILELQPWSSGFWFTRRLHGRGTRPLLRINRLESVHNLLGELHGNLWRWFRRAYVAGSWRPWSCCSCLCYARGWWTPRERLTRTAVRGRSGESHLHSSYRICHLRSPVIFLDWVNLGSPWWSHSLAGLDPVDLIG